MPSQDKSAQSSPFEIITPGKSKKVGKTGIIIGITIVVFLVLSVVAGVLLVRQQQNIQEKAAITLCPGIEACPVPGQPNLLKSCHPVETDGSATESLCDRVGRVETCGVANTQYCCPKVGGSWTTNMSACAASPTPTATASPTPTPTPTGTSTATPTPTATATGSLSSCNGTCGSNTNCQSGFYCYSGHCRNPLCASDSACSCASATITPTPTATTAPVGTQSAQTTSLPIPVTGTDWPTYAGVGMGIMAILVSILLAL